MRIDRRTTDRRESNDLKQGLKDFLDYGRNLHNRPCGESCERVCPECGKTSCHCTCSPDCEYIPTTLSSDPVNYPVEAAIAPLAYALKNTGHFHPCWSCEGHHNVSGDGIWKIPRVWFYCDSTLHVRLLSDALQDMSIDRLLHVPWQVKVAFSDEDNPDTAFSVCPDMAEATDATLEQLQEDAIAIGHHLENALRARAERILKILDEKEP